MQLFHTSPAKIEKISKGRFGEFLFFSADIYTMTAGEVIAYKAEVSDDEIIEASQLFYADDASKLDSLVEEVAARFDVSTDTAESLIDESASIFDIESNVDAEDLADASWDIQVFTARAGKLLGYRAIAVRDEQGTAYMIDMTGREIDLQLA